MKKYKIETTFDEPPIKATVIEREGHPDGCVRAPKEMIGKDVIVVVIPDEMARKAKEVENGR